MMKRGLLCNQDEKMNQENYERIAKIIHNNTAPSEEQYNDLSVVGECLIDDLAEYFESQCPLNKLRKEKKNGIINDKEIFNKKQWIKKCTK